MMTIIGTKKLTKTYGKKDTLFTALKEVTLSIAKGETVAILGKSGSGKSTLMHLLALLDSPSRGEVLFEDKQVNTLSKRQLDKIRNKKFGFVFQQFFLNSNDSVLENVVLPLKIAGVGVRERKKRGIAALEEVDLVEKAKNKANDLSGGQKQRVVIARALINKPEIIFADEPTGNLDSHTGKKIEDLLFNLNKEHNITLVIVTHDEELANRCDRQLHIKDGVLQGEK